jgi:hypothetical protein
MPLPVSSSNKHPPSLHSTVTTYDQLITPLLSGFENCKSFCTKSMYTKSGINQLIWQESQIMVPKEIVYSFMVCLALVFIFSVIVVFMTRWLRT